LPDSIIYGLGDDILDLDQDGTMHHGIPAMRQS
jgi:hypothetical protein